MTLNRHFQLFLLVIVLIQDAYFASDDNLKFNFEKLKHDYLKRDIEIDEIPLPDIEDHHILSLYEKAKRGVETVIDPIKKAHAVRSHIPNFKVPRAEVIDLSRHANIMARTIDFVSETYNYTRRASEHLVKRAAPRPDFDGNVLCRQRSFTCDSRSRYRKIDGSCNNLINNDWGMAIVKLERLIPPVYADGFNTVRRSVVGGQELPLARVVRTRVIPDRNVPSRVATHMMMFFGQFLNHDLQSTPHRTDLSECCGNNDPDCLPIMIPRDDEQFGPLDIGCMEFSRSIRACGNGPREQMNQNTAFIDGSQIYGSTEADARRLRAGGGFLAQSNNNLLPRNPNDPACASNNRNFQCFVAGDDRVNENPGLISMHTLFLREHNRIVNGLRENFPMNEEQLYQEARRIVIAELQNVVYDEYLPVVLGSAKMNEFRVVLPVDRYTVYEDDVNPNIINSFATAAYRFGHSIIQPTLELGEGQSVRLSDNFLDPSAIYQAGTTRVIFGATVQSCQQGDHWATAAITRELFKQSGTNFGLDLGAINIQRGRDHGLPSYNDFREFCNLPRASNFADLADFFADPDSVDAMRNIYRSVDDIDLWPAGLAETRVPGGLVGPTFACIIGIQFNRVMYGDRYFFNHENQAGSFSGDQITNLRERSLASIICDNTDMLSLQPRAFEMPSQANRAVDCSNLPKLDFSLFGI